jgi:hypothetical protein
MHRVQPIENIDSVKLRVDFVKLRVRLIVFLVVAPQPVADVFRATDISRLSILKERQQLT